MGLCNERNISNYTKSRLSLLTEKKSQEKNLKNDGKIRIYFYGENLLHKFIDQKVFNEKEIIENNIKYKKGKEDGLNWEYFIFDEIKEECNKLISNFLKENFERTDFYDIIIVTVNKLLDKESKIFFNYFEKFSSSKSKQPFILYITKNEDNPNVEQLYSLITNEYFDKRGLFALKYPSNENEKKLILNYICKFKSYYNEEGDSYDSFTDDILTDYKINILLCGRAGTGKSSFINQLLKEKRAKEGEGLSMTHQIVKYTYPNYPLNISDTPGFEDENTVQEVKELLDKYNKKLIDARKKINLIIYLFPYSDRSVLSMEVPLLKRLIEYKTKIIFVINFVTESIEKKHYKRIYQIYKDSLEKIFPKDFEIKIFPINLYQMIDDDTDEIIIRKAFGMDILFKEIYKIFMPMKTDIKQIKNIKDISQLFHFLGNNEMYSHFKEVNDIFISFRSEMVNLILSYGRNNKIFGFNKEKNMKKMVDTIFKKYAGKEYDKYEYFLEKLSNPEQIEKLFEEFKNTINILKSLEKELHSLYFFDYIHDHKTLALGYLCLNELENEFK